MINKYELIGILASVGLMALALFLLRVESTSFLASTPATDNVANIAQVREGGDQNHELFKTLASAVNDDGNVEMLVIDDVLIGTGEAVKDGDRVEVNYIGRLPNGQEFDNSLNRGETFSFKVGSGKVIQGWEMGVVGMKVGGQRVLVIPPDLAYGSQAVGPIPADSTLIFSIELLSIDE